MTLEALVTVWPTRRLRPRESRVSASARTRPDGTDCSPSALQDNFNDQQNTRATALWMFTDDADVAGVSASNPTSAIWWVGPLTSDGYPPAGAPTTGCINYTTAMAMCQ